MKLFIYPVTDLQTNCYVLVDEKSNEAVAIDIGGDESFILLEELKHGFKIKNVLLTHTHFDHVGGVYKFYERGANVYVGLNDYEGVKNGDLNLSSMFGGTVKQFEAKTLNGGETLVFGEIKVEVINTPGHTKGGVTYKVNDMLFCGDTVFLSSFGRVDFPGGDIKTLKNSIYKLFDYSGCVLYPGHGAKTSVLSEKNTNPIKYYD